MEKNYSPFITDAMGTDNPYKWAEALTEHYCCPNFHTMSKLENPFVPATSFVLLLCTDIAPRPGVELYQLNACALSTPISVLRARVGIHLILVFAQVQWTWSRVRHLRISWFCEQKVTFFLGIHSSCLIEQSNES
jgi:hypothetical protein